MTEICCQDGHLFGASYDPTMTGALWMADRLWMDLTFGDVSSVDWWRALSPSLGCDPSVHPGCPAVPNPSGWDDGLLYYDPHSSSTHDYRIYPTKRFFVFANFSRY